MKKLSLLMILSVLILLGASGCEQQVFSGSSTGNDTQFLLDYTILNCTKTHDIKLEKGTSIDVEIENKSGGLHIYVKNSNGKEIYRGDNTTSGKFSLQIAKTDTYMFSVTWSNAIGSVSFKVAD